MNLVILGAKKRLSLGKETVSRSGKEKPNAQGSEQSLCRWSKSENLRQTKHIEH